MPDLPLPARYLIHCEGRATLTRSAATREEANAKAEDMAHEWPGHDFDVYERISSYATSHRADTPRKRSGKVQFFGAKRGAA